MARTISTAMLFMLFALSTSTLLFKARAQAPGSAPSLRPSSPSTGGSPTAPSPGPDCFTILMGMVDCLSYVQEGSNETKPDKACCPELKTVVENNPVCLCEMLADSDSYGYQIDYNRATNLPSVCKVDAPPVSNCALLGVPVGGPTASEAPSASSGRAASPGVLSSAGSSSAPSPAASSNDNKASAGATSAASVVAVLVGVAITSIFSTFF